jgi:hypothetical protein
MRLIIYIRLTPSNCSTLRRRVERISLEIVFPSWSTGDAPRPTSRAGRGRARSIGLSSMSSRAGRRHCAGRRSCGRSLAPRIPCGLSWAAGSSASGWSGIAAMIAAGVCSCRTHASGAWPARPATASARLWVARKRSTSFCPRFPTGNGCSSSGLGQHAQVPRRHMVRRPDP